MSVEQISCPHCQQTFVGAPDEDGCCPLCGEPLKGFQTSESGTTREEPQDDPARLEGKYDGLSPEMYKDLLWRTYKVYKSGVLSDYAPGLEKWANEKTFAEFIRRPPDMTVVCAAFSEYPPEPDEFIVSWDNAGPRLSYLLTNRYFSFFGLDEGLFAKKYERGRAALSSIAECRYKEGRVKTEGVLTLKTGKEVRLRDLLSAHGLGYICYLLDREEDARGPQAAPCLAGQEKPASPQEGRAGVCWEFAREGVTKDLEIRVDEGSVIRCYSEDDVRREFEGGFIEPSCVYREYEEGAGKEEAGKGEWLPIPDEFYERFGLSRAALAKQEKKRDRFLYMKLGVMGLVFAACLVAGLALMGDFVFGDAPLAWRAGAVAGLVAGTGIVLKATWRALNLRR